MKTTKKLPPVNPNFYEVELEKFLDPLCVQIKSKFADTPEMCEPIKKLLIIAWTEGAAAATQTIARDILPVARNKETLIILKKYATQLYDFHDKKAP